MRSSYFLLAAGPAILGGLAAATAAHAASPTVLPGYWESTSSYSVLLSGGSHDRKCLTQHEVEAFIDAPHTSHYDCTYATRAIGGGKASFTGGRCFSHSGRQVLSNVEVNGTYAPERFHLDFRFALKVSAGVGLPGSASLDAHRLSATCPVPATDAPTPATSGGG